MQHVVDCISATLFQNPGSTQIGNDVDLQLFDGGFGQLMRWNLPVVNGANGVAEIHVCGLNVVGYYNEPMTLEFQTNLGISVREHGRSRRNLAAGEAFS